MFIGVSKHDGRYMTYLPNPDQCCECSYSIFCEVVTSTSCVGQGLVKIELLWGFLTFVMILNEINYIIEENSKKIRDAGD